MEKNCILRKDIILSFKAFYFSVLIIIIIMNRFLKKKKKKKFINLYN